MKAYEVQVTKSLKLQKGELKKGAKATITSDGKVPLSKTVALWHHTGIYIVPKNCFGEVLNTFGS